MKEKRENPLGKGSLSYNYSISTEGMLHFNFIANPKRSDSDEIFETFTLQITKPASQESIAAIFEYLEIFLAKYPDSENYFNKIDSTLDNVKPGHKFFSSLEATGVCMTNKYLQRIFAISRERMKESVEELQQSQDSCTIS